MVPFVFFLVICRTVSLRTKDFLTIRGSLFSLTPTSFRRVLFCAPLFFFFFATAAFGILSLVQTQSFSLTVFGLISAYVSTPRCADLQRSAFFSNNSLSPIQGLDSPDQDPVLKRCEKGFLASFLIRTFGSRPFFYPWSPRSKLKLNYPSSCASREIFSSTFDMHSPSAADTFSLFFSTHFFLFTLSGYHPRYAPLALWKELLPNMFNTPFRTTPLSAGPPPPLIPPI